MALFRDSARPPATGGPAVGVLLSNLGTPEAPVTRALRPYLRQFLGDPRVIELPRWKWLPVLHLFVLTTRPRRSAALYRKVWTPEGSPLLVISRRIARALEERLRAETQLPVHVALGMRYGAPSIPAALRELDANGCRRILVLPLYPQYFAGTVGTTFDAVFRELETWRVVPEVRTVSEYHEDAGYVRALAASVRQEWRREPPGEKLLLSFHGVPQRYVDAGDPYFEHCHATARLLAAELALPAERCVVAFQSLFGREEWIKPYTDVTIRYLAQSGVESLDVLAPGFAADCLETLDELAELNRDFFLAAGGRRFRYLPCLNDRADHVAALAALARRHLQGWIEEAAAAGERSASQAGNSRTLVRQASGAADSSSARE
jgi:ferrochelatase